MGAVILHEPPTACAGSPMKGATDEGCMRQCAQARAGAGATLARRKKDHTVSNDMNLQQRIGIFRSNAKTRRFSPAAAFLSACNLAAGS
jgi:hypothetical protein